MISVAVILGDNIHEGLSCLSSLCSQTLRPDRLVIIENPLKKIRLSAAFPHLFTLLAWVRDRGTECIFVTTQNVSMVEARILAEGLLGDSKYLMISDGDHFYPPDYLESAVATLEDTTQSGFYGGAVDWYSSTTGLSSSWLPIVKETDDYVAGGSFVYTKNFKGLWKEVLDYTSSLGEDRCWRALCFRDGGRKLGFYKTGVICHLTMHTAKRYPKSQSPKLQELCSKYVNAKTRHPDRT